MSSEPNKPPVESNGQSTNSKRKACLSWRWWAFGLLFLSAFHTSVAHAADVEALKQAISTKESEVEMLERKIKELDGKIETTGKIGTTLKATIQTIDTTRQRLTSDIKLTENKIEIALLSIEKLDDEITKTEAIIGRNRGSIGESLRIIRELDDRSPVELVLSNETISTLFSSVASLEAFDQGVEAHIAEQENLRANLTENKERKERERGTLLDLKTTLSDKKKIADQNRKESDKLLKDTKKQEALFLKQKEETEQLKAAVEQELLSFESQLKTIIDPTSLPTKKSGILAWPVPKPYVTQQFGFTDFARQQRAYNGKGHNGIDLRAPIGTNIFSAESGKVLGVGDTDIVCRGASYGRWILIEHPNGLTTLYAHLSLVKVSEGQEVARGQLIAYSGNTGYSTGPHLHFSLFASQGVQISNLKSKARGCGVYRLPVASFNSYLDPISYL